MSQHGTTPNSESNELAEQMLQRIADILIVVADVGSGDYSARVSSPHEPDHPITILFDGVNEMIESLAAARTRTVAYQHELEEKLATIETQRAAIRELSTPIIEVWEGVLCLPVVGVLDTTRSAEMTESLLGAIVDTKATSTIIDITGIQVMDTATADHFLRMARAVRLLGAECVITGINPAIAQTIVNMGVDLSGVVTHQTMNSALQRFIGRAFEERAAKR